uniref:Uncharacterized protein n=1 Tax=Seriola dumerili TaxID=41447 RepID=A0A3B4TWZ3_SERDU
INKLACATALRHTLQIVSALHDIIYYLVSFSRLGNTENPCSWRRGQEAPGSLLVADWGGTEGIGAELLEIQRQVERLSDPSCPESVGRLLQQRRQVLLLQFDTAVRHLIREAFLSSGDVASYQSVSDNMAAALPLLSDIIQTDVFSLTLPVPRPLEARGRQAQTMYSWRSFISCHGLFPLHVWDIPSIEYCMQLCLSGLSDCSRLQANAAVLGVSLLMEDVLNSGRDARPVRLHGNKDDLLHDGKPNEVKDCVTPLSNSWWLLFYYLNWFYLLSRAEIFYPSMRALAQHMGKERGYEVVVSGSQSLLPPPGASEVDVKAWQLHRLLESTECDMIKAVQRRINRELTLVLSERTRQDTCLPTELWKKAPVKYSLSPERPQMVETFIQQLMEGAEEAEGQVGKRQLPATDNKLLMDYYYHNGCSQTEELQAARHQSAQESRSRQEVDSYRVQSLEQMRADVEERDRQLRALGEQLDRGGRMNQLQRRHSVKGQLHQERCLKQEAFEQVAKLKNHVNDMEAAFSRCTTGTYSQFDGVSRASLDTSDQQSSLSSETFSICFNQFDPTFHSLLSLYLFFLRPKQDLLHAVSRQIEH